MKFIIDRFEGDYAICEKEDRTMIDIEKNKLPEETKEGDILLVDGDKIIFDKDATLERKKHIKKLMEDVWEK